MSEKPRDAPTDAGASQPRKLHVDEATIAELNVADGVADKVKGGIPRLGNSGSGTGTGGS